MYSWRGKVELMEPKREAWMRIEDGKVFISAARFVLPAQTPRPKRDGLLAWLPNCLAFSKLRGRHHRQ